MLRFPYLTFFKFEAQWYWFFSLRILWISGRSPGGDLGAKKKKKKQKRKKEKPNSGGTKSDSASDSQEIKIQQPSKVRAWFCFNLCLLSNLILICVLLVIKVSCKFCLSMWELTSWFLSWTERRKPRPGVFRAVVTTTVVYCEKGRGGVPSFSLSS